MTACLVLTGIMNALLYSVSRPVAAITMANVLSITAQVC